MLAEIFEAVLVMSTVGGLLTAGLFVLKPLSERIFGARWQYCAWLSVLVVLVLPVRIESGISLPQIVPSALQSAVKTPQIVSVVQDSNGVYMAQLAVPDQNTDYFFAAAVIWLAVAVILLAKMLIQGFLVQRNLRKNSVFRQNFGRAQIRECDFVGAPLLFGIIRPVLYVPANVKDSETLDYILAHEGIHLKRMDVGIKTFSALVRCVHWFNPLVYLLLRQMDEACEISCDTEVAMSMDEDKKRRYMQVVLEISQNEVGFRSSVSAGLSSDGRSLKKRFEAIGRARKIKGSVCVLGAVLVVAVTFCSVCTCGAIRGNAESGREPAPLVLVAKKNNQTVEPDAEALTEKKPVTEDVPSVNDDTLGTVVLNETPEEAEAEVIVEKDSEPTPENEADIVPELPQRAAFAGEFNSEGGDTRIVHGVKADENGCINLTINSNAHEVVDVYIIDAESGREVYSFGLPVSKQASHVMEGLDSQKTYNVVLKGTMRNDWKIESEYMIY